MGVGGGRERNPKSKRMHVDLAAQSLMKCQEKKKKGKKVLFFWIDTAYSYLPYNLCLLGTAEIYGFSKKVF